MMYALLISLAIISVSVSTGEPVSIQMVLFISAIFGLIAIVHKMFPKWFS